MPNPSRLLKLLLIVTLAGLPALAVRADEPAAMSQAEKTRIEQVIHDYLLNNPEVVLEAMQRLKAKREAEAQRRSQEGVQQHKAELFHASDDFVLNPDGAIPVVEFFDYQCAYCKRMFPDMRRLIDDKGDARIIFKEFPILGDASVYAAKAALAARKQGKYLEFHIAVMALRQPLSEQVVLQVAKQLGLDLERLKADMAGGDVQAAIDANMKLADALGIRGTPTLVIGDELVPGAIPYSRMQTLIEQARTACRVC
ncbi:MAG TPA: DsbA family protein [Alphaproteobacteria bacterium]|nr:DsbA family protein [Alphaproteobacteria bacterium]